MINKTELEEIARIKDGKRVSTEAHQNPNKKKRLPELKMEKEFQLKPIKILTRKENRLNVLKICF
jgi:hypothetical protein